MNLAIHARRPTALTQKRNTANSLHVRSRSRALPLTRPWFVRAGLLLAAYQARNIESGF